VHISYRHSLGDPFAFWDTQLIAHGERDKHLVGLCLGFGHHFAHFHGQWDDVCLELQLRDRLESANCHTVIDSLDFCID
jgi:hypothetical protein